MNELSALFISGHLIYSVLSLPLMGLYVSLSSNRAPLGSILGFHRTLVLLSILLPVAMVVISFTGNFEAGLSTRSESSRASTTAESIAISSDMTGAGDSIAPGKPDSRIPALQDIVFFFVELILLFSMLGLLIFALRYVLQTWRIGKFIKKGVDSKIKENVHLIESIEIVSPFSAGILRKYIFIPKGISKHDKQVILRHELNHFRCGHHLWSLLEAVLACVFWFNPMVHILRRHGAFLRELECDERTVRKIDRYEYARLLLRTAEMVPAGSGDSRFSLLTQGWSRKGELRKRIETLMRREEMKRKTVIGGLIAAGVVATVCITLTYGNLNDLTKGAILGDIETTYAERAPVSTRVDIESVPPQFVKALLVHEDSEFFEHDGIRLKSIFRAMAANVKSVLSGGPLYKHGGSTITQQLAKQFLNDRKRTMKRKFEELKIARVLERDFTKEEILEMYLNMIYFGNDAFGLRTASDTYFGHDYTSLTLSESAMLVPFIDAPALYNVWNDPVTAEKRQKHLLERIASVEKSIRF